MKVGTDGVLLAAWAFDGLDVTRDYTALDVGCGTGVMSLIMAQRFQRAIVTGVDIDDDAAAEAMENFHLSPWDGRLTAFHGDFLMMPEDESAGRYDLIICNPPFFTNGALAPDASRRCARHQESLTFATFFKGAARLLREGGRVAVVAPAEAEQELLFEAALCGLSPLRLTRVKTVERKPFRRVLLECELSGGGCRQLMVSQLLIMSPDGTHGEEYVRLVAPFYLKF